ncbi:MAG: sialate O-acetylesterase [Planctomycetaceae bacterium]
MAQCCWTGKRWIPFVARLLALGLGLNLTIVTQAEVKLPALFKSHMVLQREMPVPVWGWATAGEEVQVSFRDQTQSTTAGSDGKWMVKLNPLTVGEPGTLTVQGTNKLTLDDVLVGEVWVCSGQSNMQWSVQAAIDPDLEAQAAHFPNLRLFQVPLVAKPEPQDDVNAEWKLCTPESIPGFTAVGYFFGRQLHEVLGVPVGLIQTAWGGTRAEAWASPSAMAARGELKPILEEWQRQDAAWDPAKAKASYDAALAKWKEQVEQAKTKKTNPPRAPQAPLDPHSSQHRPSNLYNAMVHPLVPYAIRGAIWYQGESNASRAYQYRLLMPTMIQSWRDAWKQGDFPFYQVQLANFRDIKADPGDSDWAELREAQMLAIDALPNVGVACITDIGAAKDIHPKNKQDVGKRLARLALVDNYGYGDRIKRNGPTYKSLDINGAKCIVHFNNGGANLISYYNEPLTGFAIAGFDQKWVWANARVTGPDTVEVTHPDVKEPVAVRYNWADNPQGNLYNLMYLPAYPFRSDDWKGVTADNVKP